MTGQPIVITGAGGMLALAVTRVLTSEGEEVVALRKSDLDVTDSRKVRDTILKLRPRIVIQGAAFTRVDDAEAEEDQAHAVNALGTVYAAGACLEAGARFVYPSSDYVFDGSAREPYSPAAPTAPINAYGRTKLAGEKAARNSGNFLIVRTSWLYGAGGRNFIRTVADRVQAGQPLRVVADQVGAPTWVMDLARTIATLLRSSAPTGIYHATNAGSATWYDVACETARLLRRPSAIEPCSSADFSAPAPRPAFSLLDCSDTERLAGAARDWRSALAEAIESGHY